MTCPFVKSSIEKKSVFGVAVPFQQWYMFFLP
jgi:hypothetical protein